MEIAALIISVVSLIPSLGCLVIVLAKDVFSKHTIQTQFVDPMKEMQNLFPQEIGQKIGNPYRDLEEPISDEEREYLETIKSKSSHK